MVRLNMGAIARQLLRPDLPRIEVYGDESMDRGPYDVLGALWISAEEAQALRADITNLRANTHANYAAMELKWKKCGGCRPNPLFDGVIDLAMDRILTHRAHFKCLVIERALVDNRGWNDGDHELGFFKAWGTLLRSRIRAGAVYNIRLDARQLQKQGRLSELKQVLNHIGRKEHELDYWCCGSVESRDSKKDDLIQVVDLLTGAVGFHYAGDHLAPNASPRKVGTAARIAQHLGMRDLRIQSPPFEERFNVWKWKPSRPKAQRRG